MFWLQNVHFCIVVARWFGFGVHLTSNRCASLQAESSFTALVRRSLVTKARSIRSLVFCVQSPRHSWTDGVLFGQGSLPLNVPPPNSRPADRPRTGVQPPWPIWATHTQNRPWFFTVLPQPLAPKPWTSRSRAARAAAGGGAAVLFCGDWRVEERTLAGIARHLVEPLKAVVVAVPLAKFGDFGATFCDFSRFFI